ncbi:MAG: hypothetical protein AB9873_02285 [Syntrophobacteraceae bacterium]
MPTDIEEVMAIVAKSGNSFHCKVLKYLQKQGWTVLVSPYFNDNVSGKPREIDLIAEKTFEIRGPFSDFGGYVNVQLYVECKYIPQKTVFWFHEKDVGKATALVVGTSPCQRDNTYTNEHHYLSEGRVSKLFADAKSKGAENEVFFKALNQSLNGLIYYRGRGSIIQVRPNQRNYTKCILSYPVIVCNSFDSLYAVDIDSDDDPVRIQGIFQLEVNYAYVSQQGVSANEFFLIDVVDFAGIDGFLELVGKDAQLAAFFLSMNSRA